MDAVRNFSTPSMFSNIEPPAIGDYEKDLGYFNFKGNYRNILINSQQCFLEFILYNYAALYRTRLYNPLVCDCTIFSYVTVQSSRM